jgi:hypothetical protein
MMSGVVALWGSGCHLKTGWFQPSRWGLAMPKLRLVPDRTLQTSGADRLRRGAYSSNVATRRTFRKSTSGASGLPGGEQPENDDSKQGARREDQASEQGPVG